MILWVNHLHLQLETNEKLKKMEKNGKNKLKTKKKFSF